MARRQARLEVEGLAPSGDGTCTFHLERGLVEHFQRNGPESKFLEVHLIPQILASPAAIFEGLEREGQEDGLCYSGIPTRRFIRQNIEAPPHPGLVFLVFIDAAGKIFGWRWERADTEVRSRPMDWQSRFRRKRWSRD